MDIWICIKESGWSILKRNTWKTIYIPIEKKKLKNKMPTLFPSGLGHLAWWHISGAWTALMPRLDRVERRQLGRWCQQVNPTAKLPVEDPHLQSHTGPPTAQPSAVHCRDVDPLSWKTFEKTPALRVSCWWGIQGQPLSWSRLSYIRQHLQHSGAGRARDLSGGWNVRGMK